MMLSYQLCLSYPIRQELQKNLIDSIFDFTNLTHFQRVPWRFKKMALFPTYIKKYQLSDI